MGWNTDKLETLLNLLGDVYNLQYEIENCVRGCYTGAHTYEELGEYIRGLANQLLQEGMYIAEEVEEDEDYE